MRSMFSMDGKQWIYGDVFGVTRVELGERAAVAKHTGKLCCPLGAISMTRKGKLGMASPGRFMLDLPGHDCLATFGLPALSAKHTLSRLGAFGLMTTPRGADAALSLASGDLQLWEIAAGDLTAPRQLSTQHAPRLPALALGPPALPLHAAPASADGMYGTHVELLRVMPDGRYAALSLDGARWRSWASRCGSRSWIT